MSPACRRWTERMTDGFERSRADRARLRLAREIAGLPSWDSPALWSRLRSLDPQTAVSLGALVSREIFVLLLGRVERINRHWALRAVARAATLHGESAVALREDLLQEVTLHLWREIALQDSPSWEIYFTRALGFAQRHIATAYMERNGYWTAPDVAEPSRGVATPFSRLSARYDIDDHAKGEWPALVAPETGMVAAELADLRELVERLPARQRAVIVMRYWADAQESETAATLGVTPRAVRYMLKRAYARLRAAYEGAAS
jgi:RNA polymerase sigma factor (sigma-70 family)